MEVINKMKGIIIIIAVLTFTVDSFCQKSANYLSELKEELFPNSSQEVQIYKLVNVENQVIDSSTLIRNKQPNVDVILQILSKIMHNQKVEDFDDLKSIYFKHAVFFEKEWAQAYRANYYASKEIKDQYLILAGFEQVLKSLKFLKEGFTHEEIFQYFIDEEEMKVKISTHKDPCFYMKSYDDYSSVFRSMNPCNPLKVSTPFHYLDPVLSRMDLNFKNLLFGCKCNSNYLEAVPQNCQIVFNNFHHIINIDDNDIRKFFQNNFNLWKENYRDGLIYSYAGKFYNREFSNFLISKWILEEDAKFSNPLHIQFKVRQLISSRENVKLIFDRLIQLSEKNYSKALKYFSFIPESDRLEYILENSNIPQDLLSDIEKL